MSPDAPQISLRHVALNVTDLPATEHFYVELLGMRVEWRPDPDNVYLTAGTDNLALHRRDEVALANGALDHLGFVVRAMGDVDEWARRLRQAGLSLIQEPQTHRDGARSLYVRDPAGNLVQIIYHPPISPAL